MSVTEKSEAIAPARQRLGLRFGLLWTASTVTCVGDGVLLTASPLLLLSYTDDPRIVASAQFALTLPYLLFGLVGGVMVDRMDRRRLMATLDFARGALLGLLVLVFALRWGPVPVLLATLFLLAIGDTVFRTGAQAVLPSIVRSEDLVTANGRLMSAETIGTQFLGPAVGGLLFAWAAVLPFLADGVSFALSGLLVLLALPAKRILLRTSEPVAAVQDKPADPRPGFVAEAMEGLHWLWRQPSMRFLATASALINFFTAATNAIVVIYVRDVLHLGGVGFGLLEACAAAGGVVAGLVTGYIAARLGTRNSLTSAALLQALSQSILLLASSRVLTVLALAAAGFATVQFSSVSVALRQALIPDALLGRVLSVYRMLAWGSLPLGALAAGFTVQWLGLRAIFGFGTVAMTALASTVLLRAKTYGLHGPS